MNAVKAVDESPTVACESVKVDKSLEYPYFH
jgi:hypothetical protein